MKIIDASFIICIIHEAKYPKVFELCRDKGYRLLIPITVFEELKQNENTYNFIKSNNYLFEVTEDINLDCYEYLERRYPYLHKGELGVICCGFLKQKTGEKYICVIDEKARKLKEVKRLRITGTLGLLLWLKNLKALTNEECQHIYNQLSNSNFRIKPDLLELLLK